MLEALFSQYGLDARSYSGLRYHRPTFGCAHLLPHFQCVSFLASFTRARSHINNGSSDRYGFVGAPLAVTLSYWFLFVILALYTWLAAPRHAWAGVSMVIFEDLGINFRYGFAGVISTCSEW